MYIFLLEIKILWEASYLVKFTLKIKIYLFAIEHELIFNKLENEKDIVLFNRF